MVDRGKGSTARPQKFTPCARRVNQCSVIESIDFNLNQFIQLAVTLSDPGLPTLAELDLRGALFSASGSLVSKGKVGLLAR